MKCSCAPLVVSFLGLLVATLALASPQADDSSIAVVGPADENATASSGIPPHALIDEIKFAGLHRIPAATAMSRLSIHPGEELD